MQWGHKVKGFSVLQNISKRMVSLQKSESDSKSRSVSDSLRPNGLYCPWNSPGQNIGVGSLALLQGIFPTQDWTQVSCITGGFFTSWATRKAQKGCINLFYSHVGKDKLSVHELNKGTLVFSQAERQGPPGKAMEYDYNNKSKSKKQFPTWSQN